MDIYIFIKKAFSKYKSVVLALLFYVVGYLFAYPHIARSFIYFYSIWDTLIDLAEKSVVFITLLFFLGILYKNKYARFLCYIIIALLTLNFVLSVYIRLVFKKDFDIGLALSFLSTNTNEALDVFKSFIVLPFLVLVLIFYYVCLNAVKQISFFSITKKGFQFSFVIIAIIFVYGLFGYKSDYYKKNIEKFRIEKRIYFSNLYPIYYLNEFIVSISFFQDLKQIKNSNVDYSFIEKKASEIETVVLIIGESARKDNMSLYGYDRDTTPNELFEKQNMLLFNNAISPAPLTLISIPLILSNAMPDDYSYSSPKYADNIISLADYLNFDTYWLTTQKFPGQDVSLISVFENYSNHFEQIDGVYDEKILPPFYEILKYKKRKLIILHINGSHMSYCDKYPSTEDYFKGKPNNIDCYDNSIRYTDKVLGSIFKKLKTEKAALVYVSDHGTSLVNGKMTFSNTKDQTNVPLYIWYSPKLLKDNKVKLGVVNQLTQTTIVYSLISNLLGVSNSEIENLKYTNNLRFVNSDLTVSDYEDLKNNN